MCGRVWPPGRASHAHLPALAVDRVGASWALAGAITGWMVWMRQPNHPTLSTRTGGGGTVRARSLTDGELQAVEALVTNPPLQGPRYISRNEREQLQAWRRGRAAVARRVAREEAAKDVQA